MNHTEALCTVHAFKGVEETSIYGQPGYFLGIAAVTFHSSSNPGDSSTWFAGVPQLTTQENINAFMSPDEDGAGAASFPGLQVGSTVKCGIPRDNTPTLFNSVSEAPFGNPIAINFDKEAAIASIELKSLLWTLGFVFVIVAAVLGIPSCCFICDCCPDACEDGDCISDCWECCVDKMPSAPTRGERKRRDETFKDGMLTDYTCDYGIGPWCSLFCFRLKGGENASD
eukprot:TRINITY_DN6325_c0_g1_i1.p1 TRINITY_DN6325_c0_g1~~TRINITY_DN6325_c0_g1_i1.p1  ORF type:complete len:227 (+),score=10.35 TRINITY_DN6325_c0_g1_i1:187-867(+)